MKKIIVTLFALSCSTILAMAQSSSDNSISNLKIGAFVGLNMPKLTGGGGNPLSENWSSREGGASGVTVSWSTGPHFA